MITAAMILLNTALAINPDIQLRIPTKKLIQAYEITYIGSQRIMYTPQEGELSFKVKYYQNDSNVFIQNFGSLRPL